MSALRRLVPAAACVCLLSGAWWGCSEARLYGLGQADNAPDRLGLTGRVCTNDPRKAGFPVRVILLVDSALGPLYSEYDLEAARLAALNRTTQLHAGNDDFEFAIAAFGANARQLAPNDGTEFTRNPGVLEDAVSTLALPQGCINTICRDYDDGLDLVQAIVEGEIAETTAGRRGRTQYVVVMMAAGPPDPLDLTWDDAVVHYTDIVQELREEVMAAGALSFSLHTIQMAALDRSSPTPDEDLTNTQILLEQMAMAGQGRFERFDVADGITLDRIGLLKLNSLLQIKSLLVTNASVQAEAGRHKPDADGDGISDGNEKSLGTNPRTRDSDGDGIGDHVEIQLSFDPLVRDEAPNGCALLDGPPWVDVDNDRLNGCEEVLLGTDDSLPDTDGDAVPDWIELALGTDYLRADGLEDSDWDGAPNGDEIINHTDPRSGDVGSHLADSYRYELVDEGIVVEPSVGDPRYILGVEAVDAGEDSAGGLGTLRLTTVGIDTPRLSWQDAQDELPGSPVNIPSRGTYTLQSSSPDLDRWIVVEVDPVQFPPVDAEESLLVELSERQCMQWTVRNIKLLEVKSEERGLNDVFVYFAQAPAGQLSRPGLFRVAHVPVKYREGKGRTPSAPLVKVRDEEFAPIGD